MLWAGLSIRVLRVNIQRISLDHANIHFGSQKLFTQTKWKTNTVVCWRCYWTCVLIKSAFFHGVFRDIWVNGLIDLRDRAMWCNHIICSLEWNFTSPWKLLSLSHKHIPPKSIEIFIIICNWTYVQLYWYLISDFIYIFFFFFFFFFFMSCPVTSVVVGS